MQLHCEVLGSGAPLVILHGLFGSLENWRPVGKSLASEFKLFLVDQRNHGLSPHSQEMNYEVMAEDLVQLLANQSLAEACVLGHSMGGKTAMQLALLHPQVVEKLIVVDISPASDSARHRPTIEGMLGLKLSHFQTRNAIEQALEPSVPDLAMRRFLLKNVARTAHGFKWKIGLREIGENYAKLIEAIATEPRFDKPTLFIRGENSDFLRDNDLKLIRHLFPRTEMQTILGAGHLVHYEKPQAFISIVSEFLRTA